MINLSPLECSRRLLIQRVSASDRRAVLSRGSKNYRRVIDFVKSSHKVNSLTAFSSIGLIKNLIVVED